MIETNKGINVYVAFSSGKDSHASLIWGCKKYGNNKVKAVFCDTGWESALSYAHAITVCEMLNVELITLKSKTYDGFWGLSVKKKRVASVKARFCTEELKSKPMIDFILDVAKGHCIILQGIRKDESNSRSKMFEYCKYFKYYFNPYGFDKKGKPKFHTYRKKDIFEFCENYMDDIERPVFNWTGQEVLSYILDNGHKPNPLYYMGFSRVGCMPCVMCTKNEVKLMVEKLPEYAQRVIDLEKELGRTFFGPSYIPAKYCKSKIEREGKLIGVPTAEEVFKYVTRFADQSELDFGSDKGRSCMSFYGICE